MASRMMIIIIIMDALSPAHVPSRYSSAGKWGGGDFCYYVLYLSNLAKRLRSPTPTYE